jgi:hypothetical protein
MLEGHFLRDKQNLDVGTNNEQLLADPLYTCLPQRCLCGPDYGSLVDEFLMALQEAFPGVLAQFEDFATENVWPG